MSRHCYVLRVFTRQDEGGNHLGVVTDVTGLSDEAMQEVASDLGFSETVFIDWRDAEVPRARIFTPVSELPFAGHPLVGAGWVLLELGPGGMEWLDCAAGRVAIRKKDDTIWIDAPGGQEVVAPTGMSAWMGAEETVVVNMPIPYLLARFSEPGQVAAMSPAAPPGHMAMVWSWLERDSRVKARFFAPEQGVIEDPATGSAAVALAVALRNAGRVDGDLVIEQGEEVGSPSLLQLRWDEKTVSVGGTVRRDEVRELSI
jgi:trans-2,3-dihydro-3-hydroxyanthranilate isomerase